jgi:hypothetical protein
MADEPTVGEIVRRFDDRITDLRDDIRQLGTTLDGKVSREVYVLQYDALISRVSALEALREKDTEKIVATRRWLVGAVIVPLVGILLPVILLLTQGAK